MRGSEGFGVDPNIPGITEMGGGVQDALRCSGHEMGATVFRDGLWWCSEMCGGVRDGWWCPRWVVVSEMGGGSRQGPWLANGAGTGVACSPISLGVVLRCDRVVLRFDGVRG